MDPQIVVSLVGTLGVIVVGYFSYRAAALTAQTRAENASQHGTSQRVIVDLADEVRANRIVLDDLHKMALASSQELRVRNRMHLQFEDHGWYETDARGSCAWVNESWSALTGLTLNAAQGSGWGSAIVPADRARVLDAWNYAVAHGVEFGPLTFAFTVSGCVVSRALPMFDNDGTVSGYIGRVARCVTEGD